MSDRLTLRAGTLDDWYVIERAPSEGHSARFSDASIEGTAEEMLALARAIKARGGFSAKRCAVAVDGEVVAFRSPRNSREDGLVSLVVADALAAEIFAKLGGGDAKPYTSADEVIGHDSMGGEFVRGWLDTARIRATVEALERVTKERDTALVACAEMRAVLESALPFLDDHAKDMADLAAGWPENPDGPGAAATAQRRVDSARKALSSDAGRGWVSPEAFDAALREVADAVALAVLAGSPKNSSRCADGGRCDHYECREERMFAVTNRRRAIAAIIAAAKAKHGGGR